LIAIPIGKEAAAFKVVGVSTTGGVGVGAAPGSFLQEVVANNPKRTITESEDFMS